MNPSAPTSTGSSPNDKASPEAAKLLHVQPILRVGDLPAAAAFYVQVLGFTQSWAWGEPAQRVGVCRDGLELQLVDRNAPFVPTGPSVLYFTIRGVDDYYRQCVERGAQIVHEVSDRPFGVRDFRLLDLDDNHLGFGQVLGS